MYNIKLIFAGPEKYCIKLYHTIPKKYYITILNQNLLK